MELLRLTDDAVNFIGECASICYDSDTSRPSNIKRATACKDKGHLATLRFAHAVFRISGISRVCSHQFVRSKHLDFLQRSQRYCVENKLVSNFVIPSLNEEQQSIYYSAMVNAKESYNKLIGLGIRKEDARFVLPEATTTELIVVGNFQAWLDFIKLRANKHAQWEIRAVAKEINNLLAKETNNAIFEWMP